MLTGTTTTERSIVLLTSNHRRIAGWLSTALDHWQSYWQYVDDWPDAIELQRGQRQSSK